MLIALLTPCRDRPPGKTLANLPAQREVRADAAPDPAVRGFLFVIMLALGT
jgi:hypothetical protein